MNKEQILNFAFNKKPSNKGLIYYYEIDEFDNIKIIPRGFIDDEVDLNIEIIIVPNENRIPTESEIEKALDDYINLHGRDSFKIK